MCYDTHAMPAIPPLVDQFGNINLHPREHLSLPIRGGDNGVGLDLSTKTYFFEILDAAGKPLIRVAVGPHPTDATMKLLYVDREQLKKLPAQGAPFVLLDETGGSSTPRWEGFIKRRSL